MLKNKKNLLIFTITTLFFVFIFSSLSLAQNFLGPSCSAGQCQGKIGVDSGGNISIGTSTPQSNTRIYIVGSTSDISAYGLRIVNSNSSPVLWVRNDGRVSIATTSFNTILTVGGDTYINGSLILTGGFSAPISAGNITPGVFNSLQGGGTGAYAFLGSLGIATTSQVGLPQTLSVYGGGYFSGNVGIGTINPAQQLHLTKSLRLENTTAPDVGVIYKGTARFIHNYSDPSSEGNNIFVGINAGNFTMGPGGGASSLGSYNTGVGLNVLLSNTTGSYNSAIGALTLYSNTTGYSNSAIGTGALYSNTTGYLNSAIGVRALDSNTTGYFNSALGVNAGRYIADGSSPNQTSNTSVYLGAETKALANGDTNEIVIGYNTTGFGSNSAAYGNSSITKHIFQAGNVGIGTTTPAYKLDVQGGQINVSGGLCIAGDCKTSWSQVGGSSQWISTSTGIYYNSGNVGIATTNPQTPLHIFTTGASGNNLPTIESSNTAGYPGWRIRNNGGKTYQLAVGGTGTGSYANGLYLHDETAGATRLFINTSGNVGIGTVGPSYRLDVVSAGSNTARFGTTSTDTVVIGGGQGKLTVGTVDPPYTIGGKKYATYIPAMTGQKEETTGIIKISNLNCENNVCKYNIDFTKQEEGSDLWLFSKVTNLKNNFNKMSVILTADTNGKVWYNKNNNLILSIYFEPNEKKSEYEISYRLTAPRFDADKFKNERDNSDSSEPVGFIIND
ncbi:MAG: hypothetical protein RMK17_00005 [bacterium]|nr:hypothetical protein [bacterium]